MHCGETIYWSQSRQRRRLGVFELPFVSQLVSHTFVSQSPSLYNLHQDTIFEIGIPRATHTLVLQLLLPPSLVDHSPLNLVLKQSFFRIGLKPLHHYSLWYEKFKLGFETTFQALKKGYQNGSPGAPFWKIIMFRKKMVPLEEREPFFKGSLFV